MTVLRSYLFFSCCRLGFLLLIFTFSVVDRGWKSYFTQLWELILPFLLHFLSVFGSLHNKGRLPYPGLGLHPSSTDLTRIIYDVIHFSSFMRQCGSPQKHFL
jgi:hypothetical protein